MLDSLSQPPPAPFVVVACAVTRRLAAPVTGQRISPLSRHGAHSYDRPPPAPRPLPAKVLEEEKVREEEEKAPPPRYPSYPHYAYHFKAYLDSGFTAFEAVVVVHIIIVSVSVGLDLSYGMCSSRD